MINKQKNIFFLINPNAGQNKGKKKWLELEKILYDKNLNYNYAFTQSNGHAKQIIRDKILEGFRKFVIVGGDGTLNEALNGLFMQNQVSVREIFLGIILTGTGNDWARYYGFSGNVSESINRILIGNSKKQDIGKVSYRDENNKAKISYFMNCAGLGFDSVIVKATNSVNKRGNRSQIVYLFSLLRSVFTYKPWALKMSLNNLTLEGDFLSVSIGNGKFSGGGMQQTPDAINDDGLLNVTVYDKMSKLKILRNVKKLYNGKIYSVKGINSYKTRHLEIESKHDTFLEIDGELIGNGPYIIEVEDLAINIFI